jgi:hypothetical protein
MASEHESLHDFYSHLHQHQHKEEPSHMDTRSFRSFRNHSQPTEEERQTMTDEQSHSSELALADENPGALTGEGAGPELAEVLNCDPGDEDGGGADTAIGEPPVSTTEGETLSA